MKSEGQLDIGVGVNVMNVYGVITDGGCNGEMLSDGVIEEEGVG